MRTFDWTALLQRFNAGLLASESLAEALRNGYDEDLVAAIKSGWLGFPGATEAQLTEAEERLGISLPPDYRSFLATSNGWWHPDIIVPRLWSSEEIEWYEVTDPDTVEIWTSSDISASLEEHLVYGDEQRSEIFRAEYLRHALRISEREGGGTAVFLLVPDVVTTHGEWEAWYHAHWLPGASRHPSFWDRMHDEWQSLRGYVQRDARRMLVTDPLDRLPTKLPGLIATILEEAQQMRGRGGQQSTSDLTAPQENMRDLNMNRWAQGLEEIAADVQHLAERHTSPALLIRSLRDLAKSVVDEFQADQARLASGDYLPVSFEATLSMVDEHYRRQGRFKAAGEIMQFLRDARDA